MQVLLESHSKKFFRAIGVALIALCALIFVCPKAALPLEYSFGAVSMAGIDYNKDSSISLELIDPTSKQALANAQLQLYKVASISDAGYEYTSEFEPLRSSVTWPVQKENESIPASEWEALAQSLSAGVAAKGISPLSHATSNAQGFVEFAHIKPGLYLITFDSLRAFDKRYSFAPLLISLPSFTNPVAGEQQSFNYHVKAEPKMTSKPIEHTPQMWKLIKHWFIDGASSRLDVRAIKVQIVRDGKPFGEPIELNQANNWTYSFTDDDSSHEWSAFELSVEGNVPAWTQKISMSTGEILLTNTLKEDTPDTPNIPEPNKPNNPEEPSKPSQDTPHKNNVSTPEKLPQTGQLWWPVPALLCLACICFGVSRLAHKKH